MLGMASLVFALSMLCAAVLLRSLDAYRASARLEQRLQIQAAAEGTVSALLARVPDNPPEAFTIGETHVTFEPIASADDHIAVPFTVEIRSSEGRAILSMRYRARFSSAGNGEWKAIGLERIP